MHKVYIFSHKTSTFIVVCILVELLLVQVARIPCLLLHLHLDPYLHHRRLLLQRIRIQRFLSIKKIEILKITSFTGVPHNCIRNQLLFDSQSHFVVSFEDILDFFFAFYFVLNIEVEELEEARNGFLNSDGLGLLSSLSTSILNEYNLN